MYKITVENNFFKDVSLNILYALVKILADIVRHLRPLMACTVHVESGLIEEQGKKKKHEWRYFNRKFENWGEIRENTMKVETEDVSRDERGLTV